MNIFPTAWLRERTGGQASWRRTLFSREFWRTLLADERRLERVRTVCVLLLVLFLAQASARLVWAFLVPPPDLIPAVSAPVATPTGPAVRRPAGERADYLRGEELAALHLFGRPDPQQAALEEEALALIDAPETTLSLILRGLLASSADQRGLAVIADPGQRGEEKVYTIGDQVPGNAVIEAIYVDRVLLRRAGRLETLYLEDRDEEGPVALPPQAAPPPGATSAPAPAAGAERLEVSRSFVNESLASLPDLARQVEVHIHNPAGERHGFRLVSPGGSEFLDSLGLRPNDILYEVNGIPLTDAGAAMIAFEELRNAAEIRLVYQRAGQQRRSTIAIR